MTDGVTIDRHKDLGGVGCPMNMVYAKVELAKMAPGQILSLVLDDGPPINNVPASVEKEGHEVIGKRRLDNGAWRVLIRKGAGR